MQSPTAFASYVRILRRAKTIATRNAVLTDRALFEAYAEAVNEVASFANDKLLTQTQKRAIRKELRAVFDTFRKEGVKDILSVTKQTREQIADLHERELNRIMARAGVEARIVFDARLSTGVDRIMSRTRGVRDLRSLTNRRLSANVMQQIDGLLDAALSRGWSNGELARELVTTMVNGDQRIASRISRDAQRLVLDRRQGLGRPSGALKRVVHDARRIAVSETNNTLRATNTVSMGASGIVAAMQWQRSGAHETRDECDDYAEQDLYGFGAGFYPPDQFPDAPHPWCGCYQGEVIFKPPEQWGK